MPDRLCEFYKTAELRRRQKKEKYRKLLCNFESFSTVIYIGMQFVFFQTG